MIWAFGAAPQITRSPRAQALVDDVGIALGVSQELLDGIFGLDPWSQSFRQSLIKEYILSHK